MIEDDKIDNDIIKEKIKRLIKEFKKYLDKNIEIIDMGVILSNNLKLESSGEYSLTMYFTKINKVLINNIGNIIKTNYKIIEVEVNNESNY